MGIEMATSPSVSVKEPILACPVCGEPLGQIERTYRCANDHTFDIARERYVNLLLAQHRHSKDPGYSKQMIASRRRFFETTHYQPLADRMAALIVAQLPHYCDSLVIDAGCGEGYYLRRLRAQLPPEGLVRTTLCGIDISKHAIRAAARLDPDGLYAVAGIHRMPVLPGRVDVLLSHFSPVSASEFRRVVRPGGVVLVGEPGERHLFSFKRLLYHTPEPHGSRAVLTGESGFEATIDYRIHYDISLRGPGQVADLLAMTPFYWSVGADTQAALADVDALDTEVDVVVRGYRLTGVD